MTRADAVLWLTNWYGTVYTQAGMTTDDTATGFGPAIDDSLIMLGLTTTDPLPAENVEKTNAALRFNAVKRVRTRLATRYSKSIKGVSLSMFQTWQAIDAEYKDAKNDLARWGLSGVGPNGSVMMPTSYDEVDLHPRRTKPNPRYSGMTDEMG